MASGKKVCYYELLGVSRRASGDEIREAYKKLAFRYHPDKNRDNPGPAEEMFKMVAEAYEVLSDAHKRQAYDAYGHEGVSGQRADPSFRFHRDPTDLFRELFGNIFGRRGGSFTSFVDDFFNDPFMADAPFPPSPFESRSPFSASPRHSGLSPFGSMMGGGFRGFDEMLAAGPHSSGFSSHSSFSSSFGGHPGVMSESSHSSTIIRGGKAVTTTQITKNGMTTTRVEERDAASGQLLALNVNGQQQPVSGQLGYQ